MHLPDFDQLLHYTTELSEYYNLFTFWRTKYKTLQFPIQISGETLIYDDGQVIYILYSLWANVKVQNIWSFNSMSLCTLMLSQLGTEVMSS
jgi:hypothetical protein